MSNRFLLAYEHSHAGIVGKFNATAAWKRDKDAFLKLLKEMETVAEAEEAKEAQTLVPKAVQIELFSTVETKDTEE